MGRACAGVAWNEVRSESGEWMRCSSGGSVRGRDSRFGSGGRWTHAKAEVSDEREGPAPDGKHRGVKRTMFGADLCVNRGGKSGGQHQEKEKGLG